MNDNDMADLIFDRWLRQDKTTQKGLLRYTLRHCGLSVLTDIWCYLLGITDR